MTHENDFKSFNNRDLVAEVIRLRKDNMDLRKKNNEQEKQIAELQSMIGDIREIVIDE